jgi:SAM-dependent methyltransferase
MKQKKKGFWNKEYAKASHLALSTEPSEDLVKFTRWLERHYGRQYLNVTTRALDLGCGNGRNLLYLAETFGMRGTGYDTSAEAVAQARAAAKTVRDPGLLHFEVRSIAEPIPLPDDSVTVALDMMSSHVLRAPERQALRGEILRVLKPGGWLFFKSFLLEEDAHAKRLIKEHPGPEEGTYIHPEIGVPEYVWTEEALREFFAPHFTIHDVDKSHKHRHADGSAWKRRTLTAYLQK